MAEITWKRPVNGIRTTYRMAGDMYRLSTLYKIIGARIDTYDNTGIHFHEFIDVRVYKSLHNNHDVVVLTVDDHDSHAEWSAIKAAETTAEAFTEVFSSIGLEGHDFGKSFVVDGQVKGELIRAAEAILHHTIDDWELHMTEVIV